MKCGNTWHLLGIACGTLWFKILRQFILCLKLILYGYIIMYNYLLCDCIQDFFHAPFCPAQTRSLSSIQEDPFHTLSSHSLCSMSLSMNSLSSKSMVMSSASYDTFSTVGNKIQEMESGQAKKSSECRRVRSAPSICIEQRSSPQVLKTAIMEYGGTLRMS